MPLFDPHFQVHVLTQTPNPQRVIWQAMHQDYSERLTVFEEAPTERACGEIAVKRLLSGERGHYGPLEHPQITFNVGYFPHSVMQQARTHRVGVSFDVQSMRYTGARVAACALGEIPFDEVFYLRPAGEYTDRTGKKYVYTEDMRRVDADLCMAAAHRYGMRCRVGFSEEHMRGLLPFDYRQHFVVSFTLRALLHFLDLRAKLDAQEEIRALCDMLWPHLANWTPQIAEWYRTSRLHRARLAP